MREIIFYGDDAFLYTFPNEVDIYHAKDPIIPISKNNQKIKEAIDNPIDSPPLEDLIEPSSRIAICFDDVSIPLPLMKQEVRSLAAEVIIEKLLGLGIKKENLIFICATGLHRKCKPKELRNILGKKVYRTFQNQIFNHDASDKNNLITLGHLKTGEEIEINRIAAEADLIIYLNITFTPLNGGWKSIIVGLGSFKTIIPHHSPSVLKQGSYMDPKASGLHQMIWEMGRTIKDKIRVFTIEMVLNNHFYSGLFEKIYSPIKNSGKISAGGQKIALKVLKMMPKFLKSYTRKKMKAGYELIGVFAGDIEQAHVRSLELLKQQLNVPIKHQYDAIIYGVPNVSPYNVGSSLNPLLLHALTCGYLYNMYNGTPPLKKDGILIISNPANEKFDTKQHPSYLDFYKNILPKRPDIFNLKSIEQSFLTNSNYLNLYKNQFAYHGTHAPIIYYWGILGLLNVGKIIVAGAKNDEAIDIFGYLSAESLDDAIKLTKNMKGDDCSIAYFCIPPLFIAEL